MNNVLIAALISLFGFPVARLDAPIVPHSVEQSVVELHITRQEADLVIGNKAKGRVEQFGHLGTSICSGAFIDDSGDIITAGHCAEGGARIDVVTYDSRQYGAVILATSAVHDLALLHIDRRNTVHFSAANSVRRGERVFILGSPLGITNSLSTGVVAKLDGDVTLLDCGALPGNSGSVVYNDAGDMIGVLTAGYRVGMGTTHLNIAQSLDAVRFFIAQTLRGR